MVILEKRSHEKNPFLELILENQLDQNSSEFNKSSYVMGSEAAKQKKGAMSFILSK